MLAAFEQLKGLTQQQVPLERIETWQSQAQYKSNLKDVFTAFNKYAAPKDKGKIDEIGNNPIFIRLLVNIGKNHWEEAPPTKNKGLEPDNVAKIMRSDTYRDP